MIPEAVFLEVKRPVLGRFHFLNLLPRLSLLEAITSLRFMSSLVWCLIKYMAVFTCKLHMVHRRVNNKYIPATFLIPVYLLLNTSGSTYGGLVFA